MKTSLDLRRWLINGAALALLLPAGMLQAREGDRPATEKQPIAWMRVHNAGATLQPVYASDVEWETAKAPVPVAISTVDDGAITLSEDLGEESIIRAFKGALPLNRHRADINRIREQLSACMADTGKTLEESAATDDQLVDEKGECRAHCDQVMAAMNRTHRTSGMLSSPTRKLYLLNARDEHLAMMAELNSLLGQCPMTMDQAMHASATEATQKAGAATEPVSSPAPASEE